jgi:hypothetical protein
VLERDYREILEYKLDKFRRKADRIEPSYQGDVDYDDLLDETVEEFLKLLKRVAEESITN